MKTWDTLEVGDEVCNTFYGADGRKVLGICGRVVFLSRDDNSACFWGVHTKEELIDGGYTIVQPTPEVEKLWFVNSLGEVGRTDSMTSVKHKAHIAWGNAFVTKEEAEHAARKMRIAIIAK